MEDIVLKNRKNKKGFTLIEMLIVLVIIGILAAMAVSSFGSARKRARLNIAVDSVASIIKQQQGKAKTGRQTGDAATCYGVVFQKTAPFIQTAIVPYIAVPAPGESIPYADYCDTNNLSTKPVLTPMEFTDDIMVQDIQKAGVDKSNWVLMFKPPFGTVLQADTMDNITPESVADKTAFQVFLNQTNNQPTDKLGIQYEPFSGSVSRFIASPSTP